jgi:hypothetical protein
LPARGWTEAKAKRAGPTAPARPPFPKPGTMSGLRANFRGVDHPQEFYIEIVKKEPATSGSLPGMLVRRAFDEAQRGEPICFRRPDRGTNEKVVRFP